MKLPWPTWTLRSWRPFLACLVTQPKNHSFTFTWTWNLLNSQVLLHRPLADKKSNEAALTNLNVKIMETISIQFGSSTKGPFLYFFMNLKPLKQPNSQVLLQRPLPLADKKSNEADLTYLNFKIMNSISIQFGSSTKGPFLYFYMNLKPFKQSGTS